MASRNLSLTALSCALATSGAGCANSVLGLSSDREASLDTRFVTQHSSLMTSRKLAQWLKQPAQLAIAQAIPINQHRPESLPPQVSEAIAEHSAAEQEIRQRQFWDRGVEAGYATAMSEQTAVTDTDWNRVISGWRSAIAPLEKISPQHWRYGDARAKIAIYQTGLSRAERQYIAVVQNRYAALSDPSGSNPSAKLHRLEQQPQMLAQQSKVLAHPPKRATASRPMASNCAPGSQRAVFLGRNSS
ncbi:MAG: hypothetical protein HC771_04260 [Synechococcales cyanobacterium CRU_2_2]|nr:hypothetical protein [Synechococcales cyanobacterium CRU_2_2]